MKWLKVCVLLVFNSVFSFKERRKRNSVSLQSHGALNTCFLIREFESHGTLIMLFFLK